MYSLLDIRVPSTMATLGSTGSESAGKGTNCIASLSCGIEIQFASRRAIQIAPQKDNETWRIPKMDLSRSILMSPQRIDKRITEYFTLVVVRSCAQSGSSCSHKVCVN